MGCRLCGDLGHTPSEWNPASQLPDDSPVSIGRRNHTSRYKLIRSMGNPSRLIVFGVGHLDSAYMLRTNDVSSALSLQNYDTFALAKREQVSSWKATVYRALAYWHQTAVVQLTGKSDPGSLPHFNAGIPMCSISTSLGPEMH